MKALIVIEHDNQIFKSVNQHLISAVQQFADTLDLLILGYQCQSVVQQAQKLDFIQRLLIADAAVYAHQLAENSSQLISDIGKNYDYIVGPATTYGKNLLPRVAALLNVAMISDVIQVLSPTVFVRPIYAGNAIATLETEEPIKVLSIRGTAFPAASFREKINEAIKVEPITEIIPNTQAQFITQQLTQSTRPELTEARIVISGGRGLKSAENFNLLESIADHLGAAIGASRAAVDAGFAPNDYQVGQTGKVIAPDLYMAIGISGAIQHLAGIKDSKIIVAINNDPDAPIFQAADYGLVGDLFEILPELEAELKKCD